MSLTEFAMFRVVKFAAYALMAYAVAEFVRGTIEGSSPRQTAQPAGKSRGGPRLTGKRKSGRRVSVEDRDGHTATETVGRGVV
jgi:hypothetical protein